MLEQPNVLMLDEPTNHLDLEAIRADVEGEVEEAVEFAQESPWPELDEAYTDVYAIG